MVKETEYKQQVLLWVILAHTDLGMRAEMELNIPIITPVVEGVLEVLEVPEA